MPCILLIDHKTPDPGKDAGSRAILSFIRGLRTIGYDVIFRPYDGKVGAGPGLDALTALGVEVISGMMPRFLLWYAMHARRISIVCYSRPYVHSACFRFVEAIGRRPTVYYGHDLHAVRLRAEAKVTGNLTLLEAAIDNERVERQAWAHCALAIYPSQEEVSTVLAMAPVTPANVVPLYSFDEFILRGSAPQTKTVLFVAGFAHPPNEDAASFLVTEIWPLVVEKIPDAHLILAGSSPSRKVLSLASARINVTGAVSEERLVELYAQSRVAVIPMRFGAGVKLKIVEAMQQGLPLVTTTIGAQGLPGLEEVAPIHDFAQNFADAICALLDDDQRWLEQSLAQVEYVKAHYSLQSLCKAITDAFHQRRLPQA